MISREDAKKKAQSRDCSCVAGKDRDTNYNECVDIIYDSIGTCSNCKYLFHKPETECMPYCNLIDMYPTLDWFCADFERKQDD